MTDSSAASAAEVRTDAARFSGLSGEGAVQQSAKLLSISTQRPPEREDSYYINIRKDSARAQQAARDWDWKRDRERDGPSTRQLQDGVEGNA